MIREGERGRERERKRDEVRMINVSRSNLL